MEKGEKNEKKAKNRKLVLKALTDPEFREALMEAPEEILERKELTELNRTELRFIQAAVRSIECQVGALADELLCANGGPCGIA